MFIHRDPGGLALVCGLLLLGHASSVRAEEEVAKPAEDPSAPASTEEEEKPVATFGGAYPVRFARRPLVLDEGMVRADGRLTVGGVTGPGTFSALDISGAVSPVENLEVGVSTELTGNVPVPGGNGLISVIFSPKASYGDIPIYARYKYVESDVAQAAVDLTLVLPSNTDFQLAVGLPLRIFELFGLFTLDANLGIRYRNGDKYAAFSPNPSKNTVEFTATGASVTNITDNGYIEIGGGVGVANVGGGTDVKNVVEIPAYLGGGYTYEGKVLADIFVQFGFTPLMTANAPPGRDTFNVADDWYITVGATVHTKPLFGKNR
jgi:type 1 fimbria pilin